MPDKYIVEVREPLRGGDDYSEDHHSFDTAQEVQVFINTRLHPDEHIHSIDLYPDGRDRNPIDVTHKFRRKR